MSTQHTRQFSRREFLDGLTVAGTAGLLGLHPRLVSAEPPPEMTTIRLIYSPGLCISPMYVAEELLQGEGFTNVEYIKTSTASTYKVLASGEAHLTVDFAAPFILQVDTRDPLVILAGVHAGCFELFGTDRVRAIRDLKGKSVAVTELGGPDYVFLASMVAYVGLDPGKDIHWATHPPAEAVQLLVEEKVDAFLAFAPFAQELRAQGIGRVIVNSAVDRPWSQYFCCMVAGNPAFVRKHPVATKRALRAILKAIDLCALDPERVARFLVDKDYVPRYDSALQVMQELPYNVWREYDPEDTVRFYALRLHEAGLIQSSPQKVIAQGTDWRFLNELKKELKG
jgi:NitT/TauT family transport system substrate-binding protein